MHLIDQLSCEEVRTLAKELSVFNKELLAEKERETRFEFAWSGNLGHWYLNFTTGRVLFNPLKVQVLGYSMDELPEKVHYSFFTDKVHPDDYGPMMQAMVDAISGQSEIYECEYRIKDKSGNWKWFQDRGRVTQRDEQGRAILAAGIVFDITDKKAREENLLSELEKTQLQAQTDGLTQVKNRQAILDELTYRLEQVKDSEMNLTIAMVDIDFFKQVNDIFGHLTGDEVLKSVADTLRHAIRGADSVGRYGGEEFLVILPNTGLEQAIGVFERMRLKVAASTLLEDRQVTVSIGVASHEHQDTLETLIAKADQCLYQAKAKGRNQVVVATPERAF